MEERRADWTTWLAQLVLGAVCFAFNLLYVRKVRGTLQPGRCIYVCNHTSLLDTIVLGGLFWSRRRLPILVLGDRGTWHGSTVRRFLASRVGFLIERGPFSKERIRELGAFGRSHESFNLIVFPEGTRGDGETVQECQPGLYYVAKEARVAVVPVFIEGMARVSSKHTPLRLLRGLRAVTVHVGEPQDSPDLPRAEFTQWVRERIQSTRPPA